MTELDLRQAIRDIEQEATSGGLLQPGAAFALGCLGLAVDCGPGWSADDVADAIVAARDEIQRLREDRAHFQAVADFTGRHLGAICEALDLSYEAETDVVVARIEQLRAGDAS